MSLIKTEFLGSIVRHAIDFDGQFKLLARERDEAVKERDQAIAERDKARAERDGAIEEWDKAIAKLELVTKELDLVRGEMQTNMSAIRSSRSWRVTKPLRATAEMLRSCTRCCGRLFEVRKNAGAGGAVTSLVPYLFSKFLSHPRPFRRSGQKILTGLRLLCTGEIGVILKEARRLLIIEPVASYQVGNLAESVNVAERNIVIIATRHTAFVAHLISNYLANVNINAIVRFDFLIQMDYGQLHIVLCPQMFQSLPKNFIAFQMEQSVSSRWFTKTYFDKLSSAQHVFDYSTKNVEYLLQQGMSYKKIYFLPIGSFQGYREFLLSKGYNDSDLEPKIDVLFYGDPSCNRRKAYLAELQSNFSIYVASEVFGNDLFRLIRRARVIVNIHYYEGALLETTRIYEALSLGIPVISERSADDAADRILQDVVTFTNRGDIPGMIQAVRELLENEDSYAKKREKISEFISGDKTFSKYLSRYLAANDLLSLETCIKQLELPEHNYRKCPRYCLSLSETPQRRAAFLSKETYDFAVVEGLRHHKGWVGCGMSYKYIMSKAKEMGADRVAICEDDVIFPSDFEQQLEKALSFLDNYSEPWHIFSGLIADLHPDTQVIAVKEWGGKEYVVINKMTSTVMNIYSQEAIELVSRWDEKNLNDRTNTIDRFIEAQGDLVVVTTLPFLVGHAEEQTSTLWGFTNTQYSEMIAASEKRLSDKVKRYKRQRPVEVLEKWTN